MAQSSDISAVSNGSAQPVTGPDDVRSALSGRFVCPFCGSVNETEQGTCPRCTMENTSASRKATKLRIGPWYVLQSRNPAAPGMRWDTLLSFVKKGRVKPTSIVRGPSTHQLWRFAAQVKGLSREFGVCYSCGGGIGVADSLCPQCNRLQDPPPNPDALLESSQESPARPSTEAQPAAPVQPGRPAPRNGTAEPSLESGDAEFVIPTPGESLAGFSMNDSLSGVVMDQPWARLDKNRNAAANRPAASRPQPAAAAPPSRPAPAPTPAANGKRREAPPQQHTAEGFLSARDLAAAFRLELAPGSDEAQASAPAGASPARPGVARMPAAAQYPDAATLFEQPPVRRQKMKVLLVLTVMLVAAVGLAAAVSESFRKAAFDWFDKTRGAASSGGTGDAPPNQTPPRPTPASTDPTPSGYRPVPRPASVTPPKSPSAAETDPAATRPSRLRDPGRPGIDPASLVPRPPPPDIAAPDPEILRASADKLFTEAVACESRGDWAGAVAKYQAIKAYPKELWRPDLQLRLDVAEGQVKRGP